MTVHAGRFFAICLLLLPLLLYAEVGKITGGQAYELPDWFKLSFLDIREDNQEAAGNQKGLMLFMHLDACPYCSRVLDENFRSGPRKEYIEKHFDVIGINILGGREVQWTNGKSYSEKQLAGLMGVHFTPTIVFLDRHANKVLQINGYRKPDTLRYAMDYVRTKQYKTLSLAQYIENNSSRPTYTFMDEPQFSKVNYLSHYTKPLAVIFEDKDCADCEDFHNKVLSKPDVRKELDRYLVVRLDAYSNKKSLINVAGSKTSPRQWAKSLGLSYRPGLILFNEGKEQYRIDGRLYHFHFKEALRYVSHEFYRQYPSYNAYLAERQQELLKQGATIDLAE